MASARQGCNSESPGTPREAGAASNEGAVTSIIYLFTLEFVKIHFLQRF